MTLTKKLQKMMAVPLVAAALATPAKGSIIIESPSGITSNSTITAVDYDFRNGDEGVNYESLLGKHQLVDMLWQIPEVQTQYGGDFGSFATDTAAHGYSIESGSQVGNGWSSSLNADGTYSIDPALFGASAFSDNKVMNGNYFFNNSLTDVNNDGNNDYNLKFLSDLTPSELSDSLTIVGSLPPGGETGLYSITASAGIDQISTNYSNQLALVATSNHPAVPEPSTYGLLLGGAALLGAATRRRRKE